MLRRFAIAAVVGITPIAHAEAVFDSFHHNGHGYVDGSFAWDLATRRVDSLDRRVITENGLLTIGHMEWDLGPTDSQTIRLAASGWSDLHNINIVNGMSVSDRMTVVVTEATGFALTGAMSRSHDGATFSLRDSNRMALNLR